MAALVESLGIHQHHLGHTDQTAVLVAVALIGRAVFAGDIPF